MQPQRFTVPISTKRQQIAAIVASRDLLLRLCDHRQTPRVPGEIRKEARALLRHFPVADALRPALEEALADAPPPPPPPKQGSRWDRLRA